jgi:hypothetical protein
VVYRISIVVCDGEFGLIKFSRYVVLEAVVDMSRPSCRLGIEFPKISRSVSSANNEVPHCS